MFNYHIDRSNIVVVEEKMRLNPQFTLINGVFKMGPIDGRKNYTMKIQRNLVDDTFNVMLDDIGYKESDNEEYKLNGNTNGFKPFENINGDQSNLSLAYANTGKGNIDKDSLYIHRSLLGNVKMHDLKSASFGIRRKSEANEGFYFNLFPEFETLKKNVRIGENQIIDFKTINGIQISIPANKVSEEHITGETIEVTKSYSHTYLIPRKIKRLGQNITIFDVFIKNDAGSFLGEEINQLLKTNNDYKLVDGKIKTTSLTKLTDIVVNHSNEFKIQGLERNTLHISGEKNTTENIDYIGSYNMFEQTSYDYKNKKTLIGGSSDSFEGEIIPYSLHGGYFREATLGVNEIFKKVKILQTFKNLSSILQPDTGQFQLKITSNSRKINDNLRIIDQKAFTSQNGYIYPLIGLERISKIYGEDKND